MMAVTKLSKAPASPKHSSAYLRKPKLISILPLIRTGSMICAAAAMSGCSGSSPPPVPTVSWNAAQVADAAFQEYDADRNGSLQPTELSPGLRAFVANADQNKDGTLTREEVVQRLQRHLELGTGIQGVGGMITYNGQPVKGVKVTLIPEKFMASFTKPATGVADDRGNFQLATEDQPLPGVRPGIYTVKLSGGSTPIPEKYGEQSELGTEVGGDQVSVIAIDLGS